MSELLKTGALGLNMAYFIIFSSYSHVVWRVVSAWNGSKSVQALQGQVDPEFRSTGPTSHCEVTLPTHHLRNSAVFFFFLESSTQAKPKIDKHS